MRRVLIIVENNSVPPDVRVWKEARALRAGGYDVTVLCPRSVMSSASGPDCRKQYDLIDGIHIYRHPAVRPAQSAIGYFFEYSNALFWNFIYCWWIYFRRGFQVIQGCNPPDTIVLVAIFFRFLGVRYIFDHHDASPELYVAKFGKTDALYRCQVLLEQITFRFSDVVISTNQSYRRIAIQRGGVDPDDVFVVRNGPDLKNFKAVDPNPQLKCGKKFLVGYVGQMGSQDGLDILIEVASHIRKLGRSDVHFTCVGSGSSLPSLRKSVRDKGLQDMVTFTGWIPDEAMIEVLSTADVCVNPDRPSEMNSISTMIKIMEYMALGKPIVQFDVIEGRVSAGESSLYADPTSPISDFASKILELLDNPEMRERMGAFGLRRVSEHLAWEHSVGELLKAYERALSKKRVGFFGRISRKAR